MPDASPPPLLIRPATPNDLRACAEVYVAAFAEAPYYEAWTHADALELLSLLHGRPESLSFVLTFDEAVIGFAFASTLGRFRAVIEEFAVHPQAQRRGGGTRLLNYCLELFRERGYPCVELLVNVEAPALNFYRREGFQPSRRYALLIRDLP